MDNLALRQIIDRIHILKHKYLGSYPANFAPILKLNSFAIINTDLYGMDGTHWILIANKSGKIFYADSMGLPLSRYPNIRLPYHQVEQIVHRKLQNMALCGMYCIYFAWSIYSGNQLEKYFNDYDLLRFISNFL